MLPQAYPQKNMFPQTYLFEEGLITFKIYFSGALPLFTYQLSTVSMNINYIKHIMQKFV